MLKQSGTELKRSQYRLLGLVGQGQFGRVYCAVHRKTGRLVALKNLEQERFSTHKFLRELRFLLTLQHENIVMCKALEHTPTGRYLVMDYCAGGTLRNLMADDVHLRMTQRMQLIVDILAGLAHAHSKGIVHCDIKPENILLDLRPDGWTARISDFGVARLSQEMSAHFSGNTGSPAYMAPERFYGQYSIASDIYAVGILLFELLAGYRPFSGTPGDLMNAHLNNPVVFPATIPEECKPIIQTALQKLPARRYRSVQEMRAELLPFTEMDYWISLQGKLDPLLKPLHTIAPSELRSQYQVVITSPVSALVTYQEKSDVLRLYTPEQTGDRIGRIAGSSMDVLCHPEQVSQESSKSWISYQLPEPIQQAWLCPQGKVVMGHRGLYFWPIVRPSSVPQKIAALNQPFLATVERQGRWAAIATLPSALAESELWFLPIPQSSAQWSLHTAPIAIPKAGQSYLPSQLIALDSRHVVLISRVIPKTVPMTNGNVSKERHGILVEVFTRRGNRAGTMLLPVLTRPMIPTPKPYQLIAVDEQNPDCLVVIELKPYRLSRYGLGIEAAHLAATSWGFIAASRLGELVFINTYGEVLGRVNSPEPITAMATLDDYQLWISTWKGDRGHVYQINVKALELEMLF